MKQVILILILLITSNQFIEALEITDSAPDITISNWYNKPQSLVQDKDGKSVYLIEFWASWCKPCIPSIKTLNLFKQKYENKGLVVIGITDENKTDTVQFLKDHNIKYSIGFDETGKTMEKYLTNDDGLPTAFIINREGIVVYKGHPMKAEEVLSQVMNGNLDLKTIKNLKELQEEFKTALQDFKIPQACEIAEKILYINPNNYEAMQFRLFAFEKMGQNTATFAFLDSLIKKFPKNENTYFIKLSLLQDLTPEKVDSFSKLIYEKFQNDPETMNRLAWDLIDNGEFATQNINIALQAIHKAIKEGQSLGKDFLAASTDTLARCYYYIGLLDKAIEYQKKAYDLSKNGIHELEINKTLQYYQKAEELKMKYQ